MAKKFPEKFLWGTGTAAYQHEGGNIWCDWYEFEKVDGRIKNNDKCGDACDHYNRFKEDFAIAKKLNQNAHRLSIEWSRIEKSEGTIDQNEIAHYRAVLTELKKSGFTVFVTLHHFTTPTWMAKKGGWTNKVLIERFRNFSELCAKEFGDLVDYWDTINEPMVYAANGYLAGVWVPGQKNPINFIKCALNMKRAHSASYDAIKNIRPEANVGIVYNFGFLVPENIFLRLIKWPYDYFRNFFFMDTLNNKFDHIGVNYYFPTIKYKSKNRTDQNWPIYPLGLTEALLKVSYRYKKPLYVTENGLADSSDDLRSEFIEGHVQAVYGAMEQGADVRGYLYWSLTDFFEWAEGFTPRFGLIRVDFKTQKRIIRESARTFEAICRDNSRIN